MSGILRVVFDVCMPQYSLPVWSCDDDIFEANQT